MTRVDPRRRARRWAAAAFALAALAAPLGCSDGGEPPAEPTATGGRDNPTVPTAVPTTTAVTTPPTTDGPPPPITISSDVLFGTDDATLSPEALPHLEDLSGQLGERSSGAAIRIVGHTDSRGDARHNARLSQRRADAVLDWFVGAGFARDRLSAVGAGEDSPVRPDTDAAGTFDDEAGRLNRRVELTVEP